LNSESTLHVSVIDPIDPAIKRVKEMLFRPFDLGRWFVIGFCAWLAMLLRGAGFQLSSFRGFPTGETANRDFQEFGAFVTEHLSAIILIGAAGTLFLIALGVLMMWLSSRGRLMFLYCVALNKAEIRNPWAMYRRHAHSLFLFRLIVALALLIVSAVPATVMTILFMSSGHDAATTAVLTLFDVFIALCVMLPISIIFLLVNKFTTDFVVPIMYMYNCTCVNGWKYFLGLLSGNKARFTLYILFQIIIELALGTITAALICVTCCCACCFIFMPYVGTVFLLPLATFKRSYSLMYLRQYGPNFDVFSQAQPQPQPALEPPSMPMQDQWQP
jgi:hypothetical protein